MHLAVIFDAVQWAASGPIAGVANAFPPIFRAFSQTAAPLLVTAFWQGVALAAGLAICLRLAPRIAAAHRFTLWTAGFVALVVLPFLPLISHLRVAAPIGIPSAAAEASAKPWLQLDSRWGLAIAVLWIAASVVRGVDLATHSYRLRRLWKAALPVDLSASLAPSLAASMNLYGRKAVQICTTTELDRPSVIGFFAPRILIPDWLLARLTPGELDQIVLHEAQHLRRCDDWTNLLQKLCLVLFPLDPALWWIERRLCQEREMACDEGVVRATHAPRAYAACLTRIAERGIQRRAEALSLGAWQRRSELVHRVHSILLRKHGLSPIATRALLGTLGCGLVIGSLELARCPRMIAFVPSQHAHAVVAQAATPLIAQSASLRKVVDTPAPSSRTIRTAFEPQGNTRTLFARHRHTRAMDTALASVEPSASNQAGASGEPLPASAEMAANSLHQEMLKAELPDPQPGKVHGIQAQEQQWIVFTTWEQVKTSKRSAQSSADYDTAQGADPKTTKATGQPVNHAARSVTVTRVTRLVLRVLPAGSASGQNVAVPFRDGWLVIQL